MVEYCSCVSVVILAVDSPAVFCVLASSLQNTIPFHSLVCQLCCICETEAHDTLEYMLPFWNMDSVKTNVQAISSDTAVATSYHRCHSHTTDWM
jgi:hypothetical protein